MAALFLFVLAVAGGVVVGDLVWENPKGAEMTVFDQPSPGTSRAGCWQERPRWACHCSVLVASARATKRRRQLRRLRRDRRQHPAEPEGKYTSVLDQWFGRDDSRA